jgi:hypothetical protein
MPNWCNNVVELAHEDPAMIERARDAFNRAEFLNEFIPVPNALQIVAGRVGDDNDPEQIKLHEQTMHNLSTYGYANWYDWCVNEWGTKWDVGGDGCDPIEENGRLVLTFDSAWAPPLAAYDKLEALGFMIRAYYYEPGMAFAGIYEDGHDDYYDYGGLNAEQIAEELPEALDEMFNISEDVAMWEEENIDIDLDGGVSAVNEQEEENDKN